MGVGNMQQQYSGPSHRRLVPHWGIPAGHDGHAYAVAPNDLIEGKLRALGRLLHRVGQQLATATALLTGAKELQEDCRSGEAVPGDCGAGLQDVAAALLQGQWAQAEHHLTAAKSQCGAFLPTEPLAALQALLRGSSSVPNLAEAISTLGSSLEAYAMQLDGACEVLQDTFFEAIGALRSASRLFNKPSDTLIYD